MTQIELKEQFREFRQRRLERVSGRRASEELVLTAIQRTYQSAGRVADAAAVERRRMTAAEREKDEVYSVVSLTFSSAND